MSSSDTFKSAFVFRSYKCTTNYNEIVNLETGNKSKSIVVKNDSSKRFKAAYIYGEGLKEIGNPKTNEKNNILGEFLGIEKNDINSIMSFFDKYGFLFNLNNYNQYVSVSMKDIMYLKNNLEALVNLFNAQESSNINYKKLLNSVLFLLLGEKMDVKINDKIVYESVYDSLLSNIKNSAKISFVGNKDLVHMPRKDGGKDILYKIKDSICENGYNHINISDYEGFLEDDEPSLDFIRQIFKAYVIKESSIFTSDEKLVLEFLFHFVQQVSILSLESVSLDMPFSDEVYLKLESKECLALTEALHKISKILIKRELDFHLSKIRPLYNAETMQPNWSLPSLLSAMYMSLFYLDSRQASYRACQNINCGQFFLVSKTNSIKKNCCVYCTNAVSQRTYRHKKNKSKR